MRQVRVAARALSLQRTSVLTRATAIPRSFTPRLSPATLPTALPRLPCLPSSRGFATSSRRNADETKKRRVDMSQFPPERIRNLSIIAHIDHGKSTLADRLLQMTNTLPPESSPQFLDKLKVERERGITVKAQTVSIIHTHTNGEKYLINLIDTPGHVDFSYEVSRSLGACEGGLLLVDCTQGIQAQTLSVFHHALEAELKLLPVINKVDLPHASPEETSEQIESSLGLLSEDHMRISAKSGLGVEQVLCQIIDGLPAPRWEGDNKLRALVFDTLWVFPLCPANASYDRFRGVVSLVRIVSGTLKKGDKVRFLQAGKKYEVLEVGINNPEEVVVDELQEGQVGYLVCNMKNSEEAYIGDTVCWADKAVDALPGFKPMKAMVYAGVFPTDSGEFPQLEESIGRLTLNDRSVSVERESSAALGQGFRLGFLGTLHMDVFRQRLEDEYASNVIVTAPTVPYKLVYQTGKEEYISNPAEFPDVTDPKSRVTRVEEPMVDATIFVPNEYVGEMMELCAKYRGVQQEYRFLDNTDRAILKYKLPLAEIVTDFFSDLKSASSGFASFDYEEAGYEESNLVRLNMMLNGKPVDALAMIVHKNAAQAVGRAWAKKLKEVMPRQLFELAIQASVGHKIVARETLSAVRKDVTAGLYGGHYERKMKHLNKQKEGKKRLKSLAGNINIPQSAFFEVLSSRPKTFSTSARSQLAQTGQQASDWLSEALPPLPPGARLDAGEPQGASPGLGAPAMPPRERSAILSQIYKDTSAEAHAPNSEELYANFSDLYLSSPSPVLTPAELRAIARTLYRTSRAQKGWLRSPARLHHQLDTVLGALKDVVGDDARALRGLELLTVVTTARHTRRLKTSELRRAERQLQGLFPAPPSPGEHARLREYRKCVNHVLFLCALCPSQPRFNYWWNQMTAAGLAADSWALLAHITLFGRMGQLDAALLELEAALTRVDADSAVVLVNCTMWLAARAGRLDVVHELYDALSSGAPPPPPPTPMSVAARVAALALPPAAAGRALDLSALRPSRNTYAMLVEVFAHHGDLVAALTALRRMVEHAHVPGVPEYASLFKGFARFGAVPPGAAGSATSAFPLFRDAHSPTSSLMDPWGEHGGGDDGDSRSRPGSDTSFTSNYKPTPSSQWTRSALEDLFASFLTATPPPAALRTGAAYAPTPKAVYNTLLAFARATNADGEAVADALRTMEAKFGPDNTEGWVGWREDQRLAKVRRHLAL